MLRLNFLIPAATLLLCVTGCQENFDKRLEREAREYTAKHCPEQAEPGTTLDSLSYDVSQRVYSMYYTLSGQNEAVFVSSLAYVRDGLVERLVMDEKTKAIKEHDVAFRFVYRSMQSKKVIYETTLRPSDYRN